jgi:hypothetical protein
VRTTASGHHTIALELTFTNQRPPRSPTKKKLRVSGYYYFDKAGVKKWLCHFPLGARCAQPFQGPVRAARDQKRTFQFKDATPSSPIPL